MLGFELKKILRNKFILAFFAILFVMNLILSLHQATLAAEDADDYASDEQREAVLAMFERYEEDPEGFLQNEYQPMIDYLKEFDSIENSVMAEFWLEGKDISTIRWEDYWDEYDPQKNQLYYETYMYFTRRLTYADTYKDNISEVIRQAKQLQKESELFGMAEGDYDYAHQSDIVDIYTINKELSFDIENPKGWDAYFSYTGMNLCAVLLVLILVPGLLQDERQSGTFPMIHSTKRGYIPLIVTKILAFLVSICVMVILFSVSTLIIYGLKCGGFSSLTNYVQVFSKYNYCPFIIKVGEYLFGSILIKILALSAMGVFLLLLSQIMKSHTWTYLAAVVLIAANFVLYVTEFLNPNHPLRLLNLFSILDTDICFEQYHSINVFGRSVPYMTASLTFWGGILAISSLALVFLFCKVSRNSQRRKRRALIKKPRLTMPCMLRTTYGFEAHKLLMAGKYLILVLLVLLVKVQYVEQAYTFQSNAADDIYKDYMFTLEGEWTEEKSEYIANERASIDQILLVEEEMDDLYKTGEIEYSEYYEYKTRLYDAKIRNGIFIQIERQEAYILDMAKQGYEVHFVYATGWNALLDRAFDFLLYGLLLVMTVQIFAVEFQGMSPIVRATRKGRGRLPIAKYMLAVSLAVVIGAIFAYVDCRQMMEVYECTAIGSPVQSLPMMEGFPLKISLWQYLLLHESIRIIGMILLSVLAVSVSVFLRKAVHAMAVTLLVTLIPFALRSFGFGFAKWLDFTALLSGGQYILLSIDSALYFILFSAFVLLASISMAVWGYVKWKR